MAIVIDDFERETRGDGCTRARDTAELVLGKTPAAAEIIQRASSIRIVSMRPACPPLVRDAHLRVDLLERLLELLERVARGDKVRRVDVGVEHVARADGDA